jgi:hypothetical protein
VRRDERALRTFIQRYIQLPLPRSGDRHSMLHAFAQVGPRSAGLLLAAQLLCML